MAFSVYRTGAFFPHALPPCIWLPSGRTDGVGLRMILALRADHPRLSLSGKSASRRARRLEDCSQEFAFGIASKNRRRLLI